MTTNYQINFNETFTNFTSKREINVGDKIEVSVWPIKIYMKVKSKTFSVDNHELDFVLLEGPTIVSYLAKPTE